MFGRRSAQVCQVSTVFVSDKAFVEQTAHGSDFFRACSRVDFNTLVVGVEAVMDQYIEFGYVFFFVMHDATLFICSLAG